MFLEKLYVWFKINLFAAFFQYIWRTLNLAYNKIKLHKTLDYWCKDIFNFDFLDKDIEIVSPLYFVYDFLTKIFLILCSIKWQNFIVWLPLLLEILDNMCIVIVYFPGCGVINFEIKLTFLINPFFYLTKKSS